MFNIKLRVRQEQKGVTAANKLWEAFYYFVARLLIYVYFFVASLLIYARFISLPNSTPKRFLSYLLLTLILYFPFISYVPRFTLPDFLWVYPLASLPFSSCCHQTTAAIDEKMRCYSKMWGQYQLTIPLSSRFPPHKIPTAEIYL